MGLRIATIQSEVGLTCTRAPTSGAILDRRRLSPPASVTAAATSASSATRAARPSRSASAREPTPAFRATRGFRSAVPRPRAPRTRERSPRRVGAGDLPLQSFEGGATRDPEVGDGVVGSRGAVVLGERDDQPEEPLRQVAVVDLRLGRGGVLPFAADPLARIPFGPENLGKSNERPITRPLESGLLAAASAWLWSTESGTLLSEKRMSLRRAAAPRRTGPGRA